MLYGLIRIIFFGGIFVLIYLKIKNSNFNYKRRWCVIALVATLIATTFSALIPIENVFITFSSPEAAFSYMQQGDVKLAVQGKESTFVIAEKNKTDIYSILPKTNKGWKLGTGFVFKKILHKNIEGLTIDIYQYKNSQDFYITIFHEGPLSISDSRNTNFSSLSDKIDALNETYYTYYAYIENYNESYSILVDGNTILL
mgnify:FL=1